MIAGLFVVGGGLFRTGVASRFGEALGGVAGQSRLRLTVVLMLAAGLLYGFMSSTGTVAVMLPVAVTLAWRADISPSKLLIPLSFASLMGGMLTLIGTAPNLVVADQLEAEGMAPFRFFDFTPIGVLMLLTGVIFMVALGTRLLPERAPASGVLGEDQTPQIRASGLTTGYGVGELRVLRVRSGSRLIGRAPAEADLRRRAGVADHLSRKVEAAEGMGNSDTGGSVQGEWDRQDASGYHIKLRAPTARCVSASPAWQSRDGGAKHLPVARPSNSIRITRRAAPSPPSPARIQHAHWRATPSRPRDCAARKATRRRHRRAH
jgi:hypothetical protein